MKEYNKIHYDIQCNAINLPACWQAIIPLKTEYFKSLTHVYIAKNLANINNNNGSSKKNENIVSAGADEKNRLKIIKAHLQASQSCHEEILRLQRMCRELRVSNTSFIITALP
jgi:hypothetical protein